MDPLGNSIFFGLPLFPRQAVSNDVSNAFTYKKQTNHLWSLLIKTDLDPPHT
jgi:hypothetical protein